MRFKALVFVRLRGSVSDAAGNAVMNNVNRIAPKLQPHLLRIGKAIDFWFDAETEEIAREQMDLLSDRMLANTVIEDWEYELEETEETGIGNISNDNAGTSKHSIFFEYWLRSYSPTKFNVFYAGSCFWFHYWNMYFFFRHD